MLYRVLAKLPFPLLYAFSNTCAFLLFHVFRYRRNISLENIRRSFPDKTNTQIKQIQKQAYLHLTDSFLEILKASNLTQNDILNRIELSNFDEIKQFIQQGKSIFFLSAHTGPTEWIAYSMSLNLNILVDPVYKPIHSRSLEKFIYQIRSRFEATPIPYKKLAKDIILRKNVKRSIAMLADLEPRSRDQVVEINFLNQPTRFFLGSEKVIKLAELPVFFIAISKTKRGHYRAQAKKITDNPKDLEAKEITHRYAQCVEEQIVKYPSAWLWTHKRWKHMAT